MGMGGPVDGRLIPNYVSARSPQGLRRVMLMNNAKSGFFHQYFDIQFVGGRWYAWFYREVGSDDVQTLEGADTGATD
jgi:hypothetical protein